MSKVRLNNNLRLGSGWRKKKAQCFLKNGKSTKPLGKRKRRKREKFVETSEVAENDCSVEEEVSPNIPSVSAIRKNDTPEAADRPPQNPKITNGMKPAVSNETSVEVLPNTSSISVIANDDTPESSSVRLPRNSKITNGTTPSASNDTSEDDSPLTRARITLFHSLCYSEDVLSSLPNRTWAIHSSELPEKRIVVSSMIMHSAPGSGLIPVYLKQIVFDEKLNFHILLANSPIVLKDKPSTISTMLDFEDLLDYVNGIKVCRGGPSISQYNHVTPECAYRDSMNNWRHNLCTLEISAGDFCESCRSLEEILRRKRTRNPTKAAGKRKR